MKRVLFALLAILIGLATTGAPASAVAEAQMPAASASSIASDNGAHEWPAASAGLSARTDAGAVLPPHRALAGVAAPVPVMAVYLKADRARE